MINLVFVTGNQKKVDEVKAILGNNFNVIKFDIDVPEIQSTDVKEVIQAKIEIAYTQAKMSFGDNINIICEDTGLYFENMNSFPGALIKFYFKALGLEGIAKHNGGSKATAQTVIGLKTAKGKLHFFEGETKGKVVKLKNLKKIEGFGWDAIFIPKYNDEMKSKYKNMSYAEIPVDVKNKISQRYKAFYKLAKYFEK